MSDASADAPPRGPVAARCCHPGCREWGSWGFSRMAGGKPVEAREFCGEHREEGRAWWREVNGA